MGRWRTIYLPRSCWTKKDVLDPGFREVEGAPTEDPLESSFP